MILNEEVLVAAVKLTRFVGNRAYALGYKLERKRLQKREIRKNEAKWLKKFDA